MVNGISRELRARLVNTSHGAWTTTDFERTKPGATKKGQSRNKEASELGQNSRCKVGRRPEASDAPGNVAPLSKKNEYRFRRARTSLKSRQVGVEREEKEKQLRILQQLAADERIELYFGDESAFAMTPKLPYGWSPKDERIEIFPQRDKKINLFGIFCADNFAVTYESAGNINADLLIAAINDFCRYIDKPAVLVLDNAPTHRSQKFLAQLEKWMEKDLYIFFLPKYSPCPAPICYSNQMAREIVFSIFDLNSKGVKYPKLECGLSSL